MRLEFALARHRDAEVLLVLRVHLVGYVLGRRLRQLTLLVEQPEHLSVPASSNNTDIVVHRSDHTMQR